jgi:hypothetical protein
LIDEAKWQFDGETSTAGEHSVRGRNERAVGQGVGPSVLGLAVVDVWEDERDGDAGHDCEWHHLGWKCGLKQSAVSQFARSKGQASEGQDLVLHLIRPSACPSYGMFEKIGHRCYIEQWPG